MAAANAAAADAAAHLARLDSPSASSGSGQLYHGTQMLPLDPATGTQNGFAGAGAAMSVTSPLSHGTGQSTPFSGDLRCAAPDCSKTFRKGSQLESHMRHYHPDLPAGAGSTALRAGDDAAAISPTELTGNPSKKMKMMRFAAQIGDGQAMPMYPQHMPGGGSGGGAMELDPRMQGKRKRGRSLDEPVHPFESAQSLAAAAGLDEEENAGTKCVCGFDDESDYMIQCERCTGLSAYVLIIYRAFF